MSLLKEFGTSQNCPQCEHIRAFAEAKPGLGHTEACRKRLMEDMAATEAGRTRLETLENRINRAIAERHDGVLEDRPDDHPEVHAAFPAVALLAVGPGDSRLV